MKMGMSMLKARLLELANYVAAAQNYQTEFIPERHIGSHFDDRFLLMKTIVKIVLNFS